MKELCLAGACNRGYCYLGALKEFKDKNQLDDLETIAAVSIGAFVGLCYIIGFDPDELMNTILFDDISKFQDVSIKSLFEKGALLEGKAYRKWIHSVLSKKINPQITMDDLHKQFKIKFIIGVTSLKNGNIYITHENYPNMPVYTAIMASMAIPLIFPPVIYDDDIFMDGVLLDNFPMSILSKNAVGLRISCKSPKIDLENKLISYITVIPDLVSKKIRQLSHFEGTELIIDADDFDMLDFSITTDDKITLYMRGKDAAKKFISCD